MTKRVRKESEDHEELIKRLEQAGGYDDVIEFMQETKPRCAPEGDESDQFKKALYRMLLNAWKLRKKDEYEFRRCVGQLIRDVAVFVVEME